MSTERLRFSTDLQQLLSAAMRLALAEGRSELGVEEVRGVLAGEAEGVQRHSAGSSGMLAFSEALRDAIVAAQAIARARDRTLVEAGDLIATLPR